MTWTSKENAIRAWVKQGSGLADSKLIWADQTGARPSGTFITMRLGDLIPLGAVDEVEHLTDLEADPGEEVEQRVRGVREFAVSVQAFSDPVTGDSSARALLAKVQTTLALPSVREALHAAGLSPFDAGAIQNITALVGTRFESRAALEVRFYTVETASEFTTFIETVAADSYMGPPDEGTLEAIDI